MLVGRAWTQIRVVICAILLIAQVCVLPRSAVAQQVIDSIAPYQYAQADSEDMMHYSARLRTRRAYVSEQARALAADAQAKLVVATQAKAADAALNERIKRQIPDPHADPFDRLAEIDASNAHLRVLESDAQLAQAKAKLATSVLARIDGIITQYDAEDKALLMAMDLASKKQISEEEYARLRQDWAGVAVFQYQSLIF